METPDISHTTSAPSPPDSSSTRRTTSSWPAYDGDMRSHPGARANRLGLMSEAMTLAAPAARATPTAKQPIGRIRRMNNDAAGMSADNTAWNAFPSGHDGPDVGRDAVERQGHWWPA